MMQKIMRIMLLAFVFGVVTRCDAGAHTECVDDPDGIMSTGPNPETCEGEYGPKGGWCEEADADYNGYDVKKIAHLCPKTCEKCSDYERPVCVQPGKCCCEANADVKSSGSADPDPSTADASTTSGIHASCCVFLALTHLAYSW
eukprot:gnl/TRDRNA2_/TRDRNA2_136956_c0_seq1.p2 gnl/TRDRNA2_/TRDRNA2_136956_c0~~gnl/TRDRNA2_/TRDRNA2_136956_c0_seq1.p2  ORF type:complete len:144 (+),score=19.77 gnl/TRDRNA2_/TRDRNA2_136956_c0_seq1:45-476(+)